MNPIGVLLYRTKTTNNNIKITYLIYNLKNITTKSKFVAIGYVSKQKDILLRQA